MRTHGEIMHRIDEAGSRATKWGGAALALGALGYALAVVAYVVLYGQPEGTGINGEVTLPDRVSHLDAKWTLAQSLWLTETAAAVLIAIGGFVLAGRHPRSARIPPRFNWTVVGVGATLLSLMYAFMLGGYPSAVAAFDQEPGLFAVVNGIATFLFNLGNAIVFFGLAGAFLAEVSIGTVRRSLASAGAVLCILSMFVATGMLLGLEAMTVAAPLGLLVFILAAYLGFAIWKGESASVDRQRL